MEKLKRFKITLLLPGLILAFSQQSNAQYEEASYGSPPELAAEGYVVLSNGDTIHGKIKWSLKYVENNPVEIKLKLPSGDSRTYGAGEIYGFGFRKEVWMENNPRPVFVGYDHYVSLPSFKGKIPVFLCRLIDGRITVFLNRNALSTSTRGVEELSSVDGIGFTFSKGEGLVIGPTYRIDYKAIEGRTRSTSYFVIKDNGELIKVEKENYETLCDSLFGDCPQLKEEIVKNPDLGRFKNFMILAEVYNHICQK